MDLLPLTIAAQIDLVSSLIGVVASVVVSFLLFTVVASYYRFLEVVELAEETEPEEMGSTTDEVLRVQMARYLAGCSRRNTSFTLSFIQVNEAAGEVRMASPIVQSVKRAVRHDDVTCVFDERTVVLFTENDPEDSVSLNRRVAVALGRDIPEVTFAEVRAGIATYPAHGLSGRDLIAVATQALGDASAEDAFFMPEIVDVDDEDEEDEVEVSHQAEEVAETKHEKRERKRKNAILDEVTGVLKSESISQYMNRQMGDYRRKKTPVSLFCAGVNRVDYAESLHGPDAGDMIMAGVSDILQKNMRVGDLIGRHEKHAFLILAPCTLAQAEGIGRRLTVEVQAAKYSLKHIRLGSSLTLGVASYPDHGRNLLVLYRNGQKVLDHSRENDIRAYAIYNPEVHDRVAAKPLKSIKAVKA